MSRVFGRLTLAANPDLGNFANVTKGTRMTCYSAGTAAGGLLQAQFGSLQLCDTWCPIESLATHGPDLQDIPMFDVIAPFDGRLQLNYSAFGTAQDMVVILDP